MGCIEVSEGGMFCSGVCSQKFYFDQVIACVDYDKESFLRKLIVRFKYKFSVELDRIFSNILVMQYQHYVEQLRFVPSETLVIPVPLHGRRLRERGFNQAMVMSYELASYFGYSFGDCCLERTRHTEKQAGLDRAGRLKNLIGAFEVVCPESVKEKNIILVDDVVTTGSTLNECSKVLKEAGAKWVCGVVLARG